MRVGIVGAGFGLDAHLPAFGTLPGGMVVAITDSGSGRVLDRLPPGVAYVSSWHQLIELDVDAVSVATPPSQQLEIVRAALARGKHVFCEKPLARTAEEAKHMLDEVEKTGVKHMVAFNYRFVPAIVQAKKLIESGALGRIFHFRAVYLQE